MDDELVSGEDFLRQFIKLGIWKDGSPLRLHLGCGEQRLQGYVNIDYPQSKHTVMKPAADFRADILDLSFPPATVDEIRLHHVFEHFDRVEGLGLLIRWHSWLKTGGIIRIETPDLIGSVKVLLSQQSWKTKMGIVRHLSGDHTSSWGYHVDHWFAERFERTLGRLGFDKIKVSHTSWPHEPFLANVEITAVKTKNIPFEEQKKTAEEMLWDSAINTSPESKRTWQAWSNRLDKFLSGQVEAEPQPSIPDDCLRAALARVLCDRGSPLPIDQITGFNQRSRDRWMAEMAASVPPGSKVLDVGAGTCSYRTLFSHCDYKTHDFKKLEKIELKDTKGYGRIDYVSDITNIPVDDASFDVVICTEVLEHTPEPAKAIAEIARILRPGGRLFLTAPLGSGLHQLPFHFYGGFTPQWYKHFLPRFGLELEEIQPNGGFFKMMAQECARVAWTMPKHRTLHGENADVIEYMFGQAIPRYLFALDERCFIDQFTVGYHVRAAKTQKPFLSKKDNVSESAGRTDAAPTAEITSLVFSKDRAMQLQATIESFLLHCRDSINANLVVLFKTSNALHQSQYNELKGRFPAVSFIEENDFRRQVLSVVERCKYVLFLVDDNIFVRPFSLRGIVTALDSEKNAIGFSLRLGRNTDYCYSQNAPQKVPHFEWASEGICKYNWPGTERNFSYTLEVSSSLYRSNEILHLLNQLEFSNPNTLEGEMSQKRDGFVSKSPVLLTFEQSVTFSNPVNIVQRVYEDNRFGEVHKYSSEQLADFFSRGMTIDVRRYIGLTPNAAHQEAELYFVSPEGAIASLQPAGAVSPHNGKTSKPKFSILMANYNNAGYIGQAIESVLSQTFKDWELIIVDDCSTDGSVDIINRYLADDRIRLIRHDTNKGYSAAGKTAAAAVKSEFFGILDSDDCLMAHAVETMYRHHVSSPECGLIYSQFMYCDENLKPTHTGFCFAISPGKTSLNVDAVSHFKTFKLRDYLKTSGYDENVCIAVDKDIIYKMEEVTRLKFVDDCLYLYRELPQSVSHGGRKEAIAKESMERSRSAAIERRSSARKPKFSVVMVNYNNGRFIGQAIESVLNQTFKDWELIIVDDCSTDDSVDVIKRYLKDNRIRLIRHDTNKGCVAAHKTAVENIRSEFWGDLDSDDCLKPNAVETMYEHHILSPDCGMIYSQFVCCDENLKPKRLGFCREIPRGKTNLDVDAVSHFKTFKRRDYLKTAGYDESFRYAEDKDIAYKFEEVSRLKFVDECLYLYREMPNSQSRGGEKSLIGRESQERAKFAALKRRGQARLATDCFLKAQQEFQKGSFARAAALMAEYRRVLDYSQLPRYQSKSSRTGNIDVSVIIVTYNRTEDLKKCLESLNKQDDSSFEAIIVDNGGTDFERLKPYVDQYIKCPVNFVLSEGRNIGVCCARGKIVAFLDDDALVPDNFISSIKAAFQIYDIFGFRGRALPKTDPRANKDEKCYDLGPCPFPTFCDLEGCSAFRKDIFLSMNGMDPLLFGHEGTDLTYRIIGKFGLLNKVIYWPHTVIFHDNIPVEAGERRKHRYIRHSLSSRYLLVKHNRDIVSLRPAIERQCLPDLPVSQADENARVCSVIDARYSKPNFSIIQPCEVRDNPLVSVVMPAYNAQDFISRAIESVLIQSYGNFELVVVDDGSADRTAEIVRGYKDERIKYCSKENGGAASARNLGLRTSGGLFYVMLDSDDMITPDYIARHLQVFEQFPQMDYVYCDDCLIDDQDKPLRIISRPEYLDTKTFISAMFTCGFPTVHFKNCIRRSVFDKIGLYDERLIVAEDYDMMKRFAQKGLRMCHLPVAFYLRRMSVFSLSRNFSAVKAKSQFEVIRSFTETFPPELLFPDVRWHKLSGEQKVLMAKYKAAVVYVGIGNQYLRTNAPDYASAAFDMACAELDDCCKIAPSYQHFANLREKCRFIQTTQLKSGPCEVYQPV